MSFLFIIYSSIPSYLGPTKVRFESPRTPSFKSPSISPEPPPAENELEPELLAVSEIAGWSITEPESSESDQVNVQKTPSPKPGSRLPENLSHFVGHFDRQGWSSSLDIICHRRSFSPGGFLTADYMLE